MAKTNTDLRYAKHFTFQYNGYNLVVVRSKENGQFSLSLLKHETAFEWIETFDHEPTISEIDSALDAFLCK